MQKKPETPSPGNGKVEIKPNGNCKRHDAIVSMNEQRRNQYIKMELTSIMVQADTTGHSTFVHSIRPSLPPLPRHGHREQPRYLSKQSLPSM
eukprot:766853-Hanusia_phi.AAC.2